MTYEGKSFWTGSALFGLGALVGAGAGLLFAPHSGARTRRRLQVVAGDIGERAAELVDDARHAAKHAVARGRKLATESGIG